MKGSVTKGICIDNLIYGVYCIRPDIIYVVIKLSRYTSKPSLMHWNTIYRILKYIRKTMHCGLNYVGYPPILEEYNDAS